MAACMVALKAFSQAALRLQVVPTNQATRLLLDSRLRQKHVSDCCIIVSVRLFLLFFLFSDAAGFRYIAFVLDSCACMFMCDDSV